MRQGQIFTEINSIQTAMDSTGVKLTFRPAGSPIQVVRFGVNISIALVDDTFTMELQQRTHNAAGTLAAAVAVGGKSCDSVARTAGHVIYADLDTDGAGGVICKPGDQLELNVTAGATSGDGFSWIQYQQMNFDKTGPNGDFSDAVRTSRMIDGSTDL